jgi:hypothetical protein
MVMIKCPKTGKAVATGIDMTIKSFETVTLRDDTFAAWPTCNGIRFCDKKRRVGSGVNGSCL